MATVLSRSAHADQLEAELRDASCCTALTACAACEAMRHEVRAARRDALIHALTAVRPRRGVH